MRQVQLVDNINKQQNILRNLSSVNPHIVLMKYSFSFRHLSTNTSHQKLLTNYDGNFGNASGKFVGLTLPDVRGEIVKYKMYVTSGDIKLRFGGKLALMCDLIPIKFRCCGC